MLDETKFMNVRIAVLDQPTFPNRLVSEKGRQGELVNDYTADFPEISRQLREKNNWKCSCCGVDMYNMKKGLHVHHINRIKYDNSPQNLKVLCALCHKGVDKAHSRMYVAQDIREFICCNRDKEKPISFLKRIQNAVFN